MSFCRFSSFYFNCDLYIYEDFTGKYCMHIASSRYVFDRTPIVKEKDVNDFVHNHMYVTKALETAKTLKIDLPYAGESFYFSTIQEVLDKTKELKSLGYIVHDSIISLLEDEKKEIEDFSK